MDHMFAQPQMQMQAPMYVGQPLQPIQPVKEQEYMPCHDWFDPVDEGPDSTLAQQCIDKQLKFDNINVEEFYLNNRYKFPIKYSDFKDIGIYKLLADDSIYHGGWKEQKFQGKGTIIWKDGVFEGTFSDGQMNGQGQLILFIKGDKDKFDVYKGEIQNGLPHGKGVYKWYNEQVYEGNFQKGQIQGNGKIIFPDESYYNGQWAENKASGSGKLVDEQYPGIDFNGVYEKHVFQDKQAKK